MAGSRGRKGRAGVGFAACILASGRGTEFQDSLLVFSCPFLGFARTLPALTRMVGSNNPRDRTGSGIDVELYLDSAASASNSRVLGSVRACHVDCGVQLLTKEFRVQAASFPLSAQSLACILLVLESHVVGHGGASVPGGKSLGHSQVCRLEHRKAAR